MCGRSPRLRFGAYAEYACVKEDSTVALAPASASDEDAAAILYGGMMAMHYLRRGGDRVRAARARLRRVRRGRDGRRATGHAFGADVTGVCGPANADLVTSLGATRVLDYTSTDSLPPDIAFDLVLDAVRKRRLALKAACRRAVAPGGMYVSVDDGTPGFPAADLVRLAQLVDDGAIDPVVDRVYPLEWIAEAHRYVEADHKRGNVVVTLA